MPCIHATKKASGGSLGAYLILFSICFLQYNVTEAGESHRTFLLQKVIQVHYFTLENKIKWSRQRTLDPNFVKQWIVFFCWHPYVFFTELKREVFSSLFHDFFLFSSRNSGQVRDYAWCLYTISWSPQHSSCHITLLLSSPPSLQVKNIFSFVHSSW
jgi:hypothetical protein